MSEQRRDFGPIAGQMREALERYSREELADLLTHIIRLYVVEAPDGVVEDVVSVPEPTLQLQELSFPQLILHLQMNLPHAELQHLKVSGNRVWAERSGAEVLLTELDDDAEQETYPDADQEPRVSARPAPVAPVDGPIFGEEPVGRSVGSFRSREEVPTGPSATAMDAGRVARPSVALRPEPAAPAPRVPPPPGPNWRDELQSNPPTRNAAPARGRKEVDPDPEDDTRETSERFSMLELD